MDECEAGGLSRGQGKWRHFPPWPCTFAPRQRSRARRICPRQYHAPALRWENARGRGATRLRRPGPHSPPQRHRPALPAAHCAGHRSSPKNSPRDCAAASIDEEEGRSCVDHRADALPVHFERGDKGAAEGPQWQHGLVFRSNLGKRALWSRHRQYWRATRRRQGCRHCGECPSEQRLSGRKKESHCFSRPRPGP